MSKARIVLDTPIYDGISLTFKAPCDCSAVDGIIVYYRDLTEETSEQCTATFTFKDAHGNTLTGIGNLFSEGAYVKVILDTNNGYAYIQNADTNGYLEEKFVDYVVEQGTSGIWTYRKWASGLAECFGALDITTAITTATGSVFVNGNAMETTTPYPFTFKSAPNCRFSVTANYAIWYGGGKAISEDGGNISELLKSQTPKVYIYRSTSLSEAMATICFDVKGRWK